jgi:hypothetical protein
VKTIGASVGPVPIVGGAGRRSVICRSGVGKPAATVMTVSVPLTVTVIDVLDFEGREQYPISTQFRPPSPRYGGVYVRDPDAFGATVAALPPHAWRTGLAQARLFLYQQKRAALLRQEHSCCSRQ